MTETIYSSLLSDAPPEEGKLIALIPETEVQEVVLPVPLLIGALRTLRSGLNDINRIAANHGDNTHTLNTTTRMREDVEQNVLIPLILAQGGHEDLLALDQETDHSRESKGVELWPRRPVVIRRGTQPFRSF